MSYPQQDLRDRTKAFAVRIVRLYRSSPYKTDTPLSKIESLLAEAQELTAIFTASRKTARSNA